MEHLAFGGSSLLHVLIHCSGLVVFFLSPELLCFSIVSVYVKLSNSGKVQEMRTIVSETVTNSFFGGLI